MAWRKLYYYWLDHHVSGRPPSRADIDPPLEIPGLLPNLMLVGVEPAGFRTRLAGSELTCRAGIDRTGQIIDPARSSSGRGYEFVALLSKVVETRSPVLYRVGASDRNAIGAMVLLLPVVGANDTVEIVLGGIFYDPGITRDPTLKWQPGAFSELVLADELARATPANAIAQHAPGG